MSAVGLDANPVVDGISKTLLTTEISLGRLYGDVPQQELYLVQFASGFAAQAGASPSEVMWGKPINGGFFGAVLYDMPHNPLGHTISPCLASAAYAPKHATFTQSCRREPRVNGIFDPVRYGYSPNMPRLANQINDHPVILPALKMSDFQFCCLFPAQPATQKEPEQSPVSLALQRIRVRHLPERSCLVGGEPVTESDAEILRPFDPTDAGSEIGAEQSGIGSFICEAPDGC